MRTWRPTAVLAALTIVSLATTPATGSGVAADPLAAIEADGARRAIEYLAADARGGREAGTPGNRAAAAWIGDRLAELGLTPGGDPVAEGSKERGWLQRFRAVGTDCHNIVAVVPGREPQERAGHVLIGAHYDHVGRGHQGGLSIFGGRGEVHNGADDNASGSAALLEVAEAFMARPEPPARTVVLVWFDAEEKGLLGAQHFAKHPLYPLRRCAMMINLDMVGRSRGGRATLLGATSGVGLPRVLIDAADSAGLDLTVAPYMVPNSDHYAFYLEKVPVAFMTTGLHTDYHRPGDDTPKINAEGLVRVARTTYLAAAEVADAPARRFAWQEVGTAPVGLMALEALQGLTGEESFGTIARLAYGPVAGLAVAATDDGLSVAHAQADGALTAAGVRTGDVLLRARGGFLGDEPKALTGPLARIRLLMALSGRPAVLELRRGDQTLQLDFPPRD
jgi:hypothetical protein